MSRKFVSALIFSLFATAAHAAPQLSTFSGTALVSFPCSPNCVLFGSVVNNTPFAGTVSYDPVSQEVLSLTVAFPQVTLTASEFIVQSVDTPAGGAYLNINGRVTFGPAVGYYVNLSLINLTTPAPDVTQPLSCADWDVCQLVIQSFEGAAQPPPQDFAIWAANVDNATPSQFSFLTPAPACRPGKKRR